MAAAQSSVKKPVACYPACNGRRVPNNPRRADC
jgi:hypothetical protein